MSCLGFFNQRVQPCGGFWVHVKLIAGFIHIFFWHPAEWDGSTLQWQLVSCVFFPLFFLGGNGTTRLPSSGQTWQWTNKHPLIVEFPRTPPFFEDFRLPWLITSQYSLPIPKAGDFSPSRGQEGIVGSPWVSVFPCSLLNGEKKELPTTCALMCHDQMVKIWIFSPWALV